jgi:hypothetical protein
LRHCCGSRVAEKRWKDKRNTNIQSRQSSRISQSSRVGAAAAAAGCCWLLLAAAGCCSSLAPGPLFYQPTVDLIIASWLATAPLVPVKQLMGEEKEEEEEEEEEEDEEEEEEEE